MALNIFKNKKGKEKSETKKTTRKQVEPKTVEVEKKPKKEEPRIKTKQSTLAAQFLLQPHITEQSTDLAKKNVYTFKVNPSANKVIIKKAIKEMYGFEPIKIRVINTHSKKRSVRGKIGTKSGFKKALVYLKEGDKIEFI